MVYACCGVKQGVKAGLGGKADDTAHPNERETKKDLTVHTLM